MRAHIRRRVRFGLDRIAYPVVRGQTGRIQELARRLMKTRGVTQLKLSMVDV